MANLNIKFQEFFDKVRIEKSVENGLEIKGLEIEVINKNFNKIFNKDSVKRNFLQKDILNLLKIKENINNDYLLKQLEQEKGEEKIKLEILETFDTMLENLNSYYDKNKKIKFSKLTKESFEMLIKILKNRRKKMEKRFAKIEINSEWSLERKKIEFFYEIQKPIKEVFESIKLSIMNGIKLDDNFRIFFKELNLFFSSLGIWTYIKENDYQVTEEDEDYFMPLKSAECDTKDKDKKNKIKEFFTYPYMMIIDEKEGVSIKEVLIEGEVVFWRYIGD